jgi:AraC-like DNA-binding protein
VTLDCRPSRVSSKGNIHLANGRVIGGSVWQPGVSSVESAPMALQMFHNHPALMTTPHWHAQVEVNFIMRGTVHYLMADHEMILSAGDLCLFWGGLPHQMDWRSEDTIYAGAHLPLVHFFRLHLPDDVPRRLMAGETLVSQATDAADYENFARWNLYVRSGDAARAEHAVDELLLRLERVRFEPYRLVPGTSGAAAAPGPSDQQASRAVRRMCDFIANGFLDDIDSVDIAAAAGIHPKYAMSLFRKSTGMTLNEYVSLLRLSYAQALLMNEDVNVIEVAMESGFGSLSAFNKSFRKLAGMSPSSFRKVSAAR